MSEPATALSDYHNLQKYFFSRWHHLPSCFSSNCNNFESIYPIFLQLDLFSLANRTEQFFFIIFFIFQNGVHCHLVFRQNAMHCISPYAIVCVCVRACVRTCVRACVRACVLVCVCVLGICRFWGIMKKYFL